MQTPTDSVVLQLTQRHTASCSHVLQQQTIPSYTWNLPFH